MKKAQSASGAGAVLGIIAGFIILYFLLIPPDVREELLGINETGEEGEEAEEITDANVLLLESPGTVSEQRKDEYEHDLNSFNLFTRAEDSVLKDVGSFYVESSKGSKKIKEVILVVADPANTENAKLSFNVAEHKNRLIITLNDIEIFNSEASGFTQVALENVKKENLLKFSSPETSWFNLFGKNFYELSDVKVTATIEDISNMEAMQTFFISATEYQNLEEAYLRYFVDCRPATSGRLRIYLNDVLLSSKVPDCGSAAKTNIDSEYLAAGTNTLRFYADEGNFLLDQVAVKTQLKEPAYPLYYFEINATQWNWIENDERTVGLYMDFAGIDEDKRAELTINGHKTMIDTDKESYTEIINKNHLREKNNYIRIIPEGTIEIVELKIKLVE